MEKRLAAAESLALAQLGKIQKLQAENERLKRRVSSLQQQLVDLVEVSYDVAETTGV